MLKWEFFAEWRCFFLKGEKLWPNGEIFGPFPQGGISPKGEILAQWGNFWPKGEMFGPRGEFLAQGGNFGPKGEILVFQNLALFSNFF